MYQQHEAGREHFNGQVASRGKKRLGKKNTVHSFIMDPEKKTIEPAVIIDAVPAGPGADKIPQAGVGGGPPIPPQHSRFYCSSCRTPYDLPHGSTSWRCASCHTFNSTTPDQCPWCTVM